MIDYSQDFNIIVRVLDEIKDELAGIRELLEDKK